MLLRLFQNVFADMFYLDLIDTNTLKSLFDRIERFSLFECGFFTDALMSG